MAATTGRMPGIPGRLSRISPRWRVQGPAGMGHPIKASGSNRRGAAGFAVAADSTAGACASPANTSAVVIMGMSSADASGTPQAGVAPWLRAGSMRFPAMMAPIRPRCKNVCAQTFTIKTRKPRALQRSRDAAAVLRPSAKRIVPPPASPKGRRCGRHKGKEKMLKAFFPVCTDGASPWRIALG
jgi:hypothetical protein